MMEVEDPPADDRRALGYKGCFPIQPFKCLPPMLLAFIPGTWQKIHDKTHFCLVFGVIAMCILVIQTVVSIFYANCFQTLCFKEVLIIVFILPCAVYSFRIIGQYDERLQNKQQKAKDAKVALTASYNSILVDMDGMLQKSAESSSGLAERSFESKRRDFQRFLERAKPKFDKLYMGTKADNDQLLKQFRLFCCHWLQVFEECSIDPTQRPQRIATPEELFRCTTVADVADLLLERLRVTEVKFLSAGRDQMAQTVQKHKGLLCLLDKKEKDPEVPDNTPPPPVEKWFSCGMGKGCQCQCTNKETDTGYPKECKCICFRAAMLSPEHVKLIFGFLFGIPLFVLEVAPLINLPIISDSETGRVQSIIGVVMVVVAELCFLLMLSRFEEIDIIQQLEREVKELERQNQQVQEQNERMREFWNNAQQLTELWLYRTVPRLDLYKEMHSLLEDSDKDDLLVNLAGANQCLENLESKLGALELWRNDGAIKPEDKKAFGKCVNQVTQLGEISDMFEKLNEVSSNKMHFLKDVHPETNSKK